VRLNHGLAACGDAVAAYTISLDLPFAQARWCGAEGVATMQTLSDWKTRSFGTSWGVLLEETQLLARAIFVLDADGTVTYTQIVPEITHEPEYEPVFRGPRSRRRLIRTLLQGLARAGPEPGRGQTPARALTRCKAS
jgi:thiol peroxidase